MEPADPQVVPRQAGLFGADRMTAVTAEREDVAKSLRHRLAIHRKADDEPAAEATIPKGAGQPLSAGVRKKIEPKLGAELGDVRVHTGSDSAQAATQLGARAFTTGRDVHFGSGQFAPGTKEGDRLLVHELTHVVQGQRSGIQRKEAHDSDATGEHAGHEVSQPGEPAEQEADAVADKVTEDLHAPGGDKGAKDAKKDKQNGGAEAASAHDKHGAHDQHGGAAADGHGSEQRAGSVEAKAGGSEGGAPKQDAAGIGAATSSTVARKILRKPSVLMPIVAPQPFVGRKIFRKAPPKTTAAPAAGTGKASGKGPAPDSERQDLKTECRKRGGAAATIVLQLENEPQIDEGTKAAFFKEAGALLKPGGNPLDAIHSAINANASKYLCRGIDITEEAVKSEKGVNRFMDLPSVHGHYLAPPVKAAFPVLTDFLGAAKKGQFDPYRHMNETAVLRGKAPLSWWTAGPPLAGGIEMGKVMKDLHVDDEAYAEGAVRLEIPPDEFVRLQKANGLHIFKPTAFDGAFQIGKGGDALFNAKSGDSVWGVTHGGAKEAVMKPMPIKVFKVRRLITPSGDAPAADTASLSSSAAKTSPKAPPDKKGKK